MLVKPRIKFRLGEKNFAAKSEKNITNAMNSASFSFVIFHSNKHSTDTPADMNMYSILFILRALFPSY